MRLFALKKADADADADIDDDADDDANAATALSSLMQHTRQNKNKYCRLVIT